VSLVEYKSQMLRFRCAAMESMAATLEAIAQLHVLMAKAEVILDRAQFPSSSCERFRPARCRYRSVAGRDALGQNFCVKSTDGLIRIKSWFYLLPGVVGLASLIPPHT
jgi:hypothetical protein